MWQQQLDSIRNGDVKALARCISLVENESGSYDSLLRMLPPADTPVIGITGPPGAGKSTLVDALIGALVEKGKRVAVLCIDPSSPFNLGALLGDRIRMSEWYNHPDVFIRSLATRGSLGGLHPRIIEITDLVKAAPFDYVIVETVGVGQSEVEVAGLADVTVVVVVPEAGDEVQTMKAGLMEIADIFVVNKSDRPDADQFVRNLRLMMEPGGRNNQLPVPVIKTCALQKNGIEELVATINTTLESGSAQQERHLHLLAEKAYCLIRNKRMKDIDKERLKEEIGRSGEVFNLYKYIDQF